MPTHDLEAALGLIASGVTVAEAARRIGLRDSSLRAAVGDRRLVDYMRANYCPARHEYRVPR